MARQLASGLLKRLCASLRAASGAAILLALFAVALPAEAAFNNTTPRATFAGTHNYVLTGGSLRSNPNTTNACSLVTTRTATLSGIPAGSTIAAAYLYWGGSGATPDYTVGFNAGNSLTSTTNITALAANRFTETYTTKSFFGGFYDVTSLVTGNGSYTFGGLTVDAAGEYCSGQNVLSAWALVVVYRNSSEPYRYTRIYDGLQLFRGSAVTTTQTGFRVPDLLDGKVSVVTWEGDPDSDSSFPLDGFTEALTFDGHNLSNPGCDGTDNMYNSTMGTPSSCVSTVYGADIDTFNVTPWLYEGQSSATIRYSSGNDAVFLSTQIISTTNTPVADLGIIKTHNGSNFTAGQNGSYNIVVHNYGPEIATGTTTVSDTLPTGLTFVSGSGTGWTCGAVGQVVSCTNSQTTLNVGSDLPTLVLTVAVSGQAAASTQNTAEVLHPMFDGTGGNQTSTDTVTVRRADLSASKKEVTDVNGGTVQPGDTLHYKITLTAASGPNAIDATGVTVVDDLAANLGELQLTAVPAGATDNSIGSGGANGTGQVNISNITVPAGTSKVIEFDVVVSPDALPGDHIDNSATITSVTGPSVTVTAPQQTIPDPAPPTSGNKVLYVYDKQSTPIQSLSRTPQPTTTSGTNYIIVLGNNSQTWPMSGPVADGKSLVLPQQTITVYLFTRAGNNSTNTSRSTTVSLLHGNTVIATSAAQNISGNGITRRTYTIDIPAGGYSFSNNDSLSLRFDNDGTNTKASNREVWVYGRSTGNGAMVCVTLANCSKVTFNTSTVINVDSVEMFSAPYPALTQKAQYEAGDHVYIRADISDPFGGYDVSAATLSLTDGNGASVGSGLAMTAMTSPAYDSGTPNRFFEYEYIIPASPNYGTFTATVTAAEGSEGTITHTRPNTFTVVPTTAPPTPSGNKVLYVYDNQLATGNPRQQMTRTPQPTATSGTNYIIVPGNNNRVWPMAGPVPAGKTLVLPPQTINVYLYAASGRQNLTTNRGSTVTLYSGSQTITSASQNINSGTIGRKTYTLAIPTAVTIAAGQTLNLRFNNTNGTPNNEIWIYGRPSTTPLGSTACVTLTECSKVTFTANTVVNVDSVEMFSAAYPATTQKEQYRAGDHVYIRATISDPFGGYDVSGATLLLKDGSSNPVVSGLAMPAKTSPAWDSETATRVFEYDYTIPASPNYGTYTATVTGAEGFEGTVTHSRSNTFVAERLPLQVVKSHSGDFTAGANNSYTLTVSNSNGSTVSGTTMVKDTLATGLTFVSGTGTGWSCSAAGQVVTCTSTASIAASSSMAPITLTVAVAGNMGTSVANQASVGNSTINGGAQNAGNTDTAIIVHPNLSTSTKSVSDLNGGDANPGDTLRYTITVKETAGVAANNVTVTDALPSGLTGLSALNAGLSTCSGTPSVVGSTLTVTGLTVAGGGSCNLVFDVQVSAGAGAGLVIENSATIANPAGEGATPSVSITVAQSQVAASGNKILYVYADNTMTRTPQSASATNTTSSGVGAFHDFVLAPVESNLNIAPGSTINVDLWLARSGSTTTPARTVYIKLYKRTGSTDTQIGGQSNSVLFSDTTLAKQSFTITAPSFGTAGNLAAGDKLVLRLYNDSDTGGNDRAVTFQQYQAGSRSTVTISTPTVVHVNSVTAYSAPYGAETQAAAYGQGDTVYVRAKVIDPFGAADISGGTITIKNPSGTTVTTANLVNGTHTKSASGAERIYEYAFTVPAAPPTGTWTAIVTANEGSEGTVTHTASGTFDVGGRVTLRKTWGGGATAGHAVTLTITGGTGAVAGSSTAPSTLTPATSNAATGATITLTEAYTNGVPGMYTTTLACTKDSDGTTVTPSGTGLSRTIVMPAGSVTCTYTNGVTVPLTVVKVATTVKDPVNGTVNPKAIPGAVVRYDIVVTNPAANPLDSNTVVITDEVPQHLSLCVAHVSTTGCEAPQFIDGSPASGLTYTFTSLSNATDDIEFYSDGAGPTPWGYSPAASGLGTDSNITKLRISPKGSFNANNAQFTLQLWMRVE